MRKFFKYPWLIIASVLVLTVFFIFQLPNLKIDSDVSRFLPPDHPSRIADDKAKEIFGRNEMMGVILHTENGTIFTAENIKIIKEVSERIEDIKNVREITSLTTADYLSGENGTLKTEEIVESLPVNQDDLESIKEKAFSWDIYQRFLYSDDLKSTQIAVKLEKEHTEEIEVTDNDGNIKKKMVKVVNTTEHDTEVYFAIKKILDEYKDRNLNYYIAGVPAVQLQIVQNIRSDLMRLIPFVILVLLLVLYFSFHKLGGVILPSINVVISTIWTIGIMIVTGTSFKIMSVIVPIILIAVGSAYAIHLVSHYFDDMAERKDGDITASEHADLVFKTIKNVGSPILLAALTTMVGFASLSVSSLVMIREFGIFTAVGVGVALIIASTFIPALLLIKNHEKVKAAAGVQNKDGHIRAILNFIDKYLVKKPKVTLILSIVVVVLGVTGILRTTIGKPMIDFFSKKTEIRQSDTFANKHFNGTTMLSVLIKGNEITNQIEESQIAGSESEDDDFNFDEEEENTDDDFNFDEEAGSASAADGETAATKSAVKSYRIVKTPLLLHEMDIFKTYLVGKHPEVKQVMSFADMVKKMNMVMHEDESDSKSYNEIPHKPEKYNKSDMDGLQRLISQYLVLYSGNLDEVIDDMDNPVITKLTVQLNTAHPGKVKKVKEDIINYAEEKFNTLGYTTQITGEADVMIAVNELIISTQIMTILLALVIVFLILTVKYRSPTAGLLGAIPIVFSLLVNFGLMGYAGIPLDIITSLVASITIGIGIDYAIHFMAGYKRERKKTENLSIVTERTINKTGKAIFFNAASVALGFGVLMFSSFAAFFYFSLLLCLTMVTSSLAAMTILPVLLNKIKPQFIGD